MKKLFSSIPLIIMLLIFYGILIITNILIFKHSCNNWYGLLIFGNISAILIDGIILVWYSDFQYETLYQFGKLHQYIFQTIKQFFKTILSIK